MHITEILSTYIVIGFLMINWSLNIVVSDCMVLFIEIVCILLLEGILTSWTEAVVFSTNLN